MYRKKIDQHNTLFKTRFFPWHSSSRERVGNVAFLGIGGNIGDSKRLFHKLFCYLQRDSSINIIETSPILKNPPFGYLEQNDFYNAMITITTSQSPKKLLDYILRIEKHFGRKRSFIDAPRTLDIDMIFYNSVVMNSKNLTLPHPHWYKRNSVVIPLSMMKGTK